MQTILMLGGYHDPVPAREEELREALRRNCECRAIDSIRVFVEDEWEAFERTVRHAPEYHHEKVQMVETGIRMTYRAYFEYADRAPGDLCVIANSDIAFDETLAAIKGIDWKDTLVCLSRTEPDGSPPEWMPGQHWADNSQDAWMFRSPIKPFPCDWKLGTEGCDNVLAYEATRAGLRLVNPWFDVKAWHLHDSGVRRNFVRRDGAPSGPHFLVPRVRLVPCKSLR
jgi:hypothetical protein